MPIRQITTKYFTFDQNNCNGRMIYDMHKGVGDYVIIEAVDYSQANGKAREILEDSWGDNTRSGSRWDALSSYDEGTEDPCVYGDVTIANFAKENHYNRQYCVWVHHLDGAKDLWTSENFHEWFRDVYTRKYGR